MDKLAVMNAFCRIVARGSFVRAAEDLGVSPALLSRELKALEESLGCTLIARTTRTMSLTEHGRVYHDEALRILADVDALDARLSEHSGEVRGHLRVNAPHSFGHVVLAPILPAFLAAHPALTLSLSLDDRVVDMIEGGFDLTIRARPELPDSSLVARRLAVIRQGLYAAPAHLAAHGEPLTPQALSDHPAVTYTLADDTLHWPLDGPDGRQLVTPKPRLQVGSSLLLRDMLVAGLGIGSLPDFIAEPELRAGRLARVLPRHALPPRHVYAVTASRRGLDAKALAFLEHLRIALTPRER